MAEKNKDNNNAKSSGMKTITYILISSVASIVITTVILFMVMGFLGKEESAPVDEAPVYPTVNSRTAKSEIGPTYELLDMVVNISGPKKLHYLKFSLYLEAENADVSTELTTKDVILKDRVLSIFASLNYNEASKLFQPDENGITGKEKLEVKILENINDILSKGKIVAVYVTQFVIQ